mmetsp:Transcript_35290/g.34289  ORF Transcript_35290/g.34289 Transcript_35290/m.34289 type:complete len:169 (+) Transcript_35290:64-570(+)
MQGESGELTLRKWNPKKEEVPQGEDNSAEVEEGCDLCYGGCIGALFSVAFEETIEWVYEEPISKEEIFKKELENNHTSTVVFRVVGFLLMFFGIGLFFSPIIELFKWIPLVGSFLSFGVALACWIFAFLAAGIGSLFTIGLAWLFFRPLYGIIMLGIMGVLVVIMFTV